MIDVRSRVAFRIEIQRHSPALEARPMSTVNRRTFLKTGAVGAAGLSLCGPQAVVRAQAPKPAQPPQADDRPLLRLEGGGPTTFVTSLAFSPDGQTLYAAGFDKVVRVWKLQGGRF